MKIILMIAEGCLFICWSVGADWFGCLLAYLLACLEEMNDLLKQ